MNPAKTESMKKEAFGLFEDGKYEDSLRLCRAILAKERDQAIEVLCASNLFSTGDFEEAEVSFRDLAVRIPDSSYVHSFLAKVLEARGDEAAVAEYATAVHLDPANQDALRSYAGYLLSHNDFRGSLPVLRRLVQIGKKPGDLRKLVHALTEAGEPEEAIAAAGLLGEGPENSPEIVQALLAAGRYAAATEIARALWQATGDPARFTTYLRALSQCNRSAALDACTAYLAGEPGLPAVPACIQLLREMGRSKEALAAVRSLPAFSAAPEGRRTLCELLGEAGFPAEALAEYEALIHEEQDAPGDPEFFRTVLGGYRELLLRQAGPVEARSRFLRVVSGDVNVAGLTETARFFEDTGETGAAKSWYYRAYRADFLAGGLPYGSFLSRHNETRECEKVMLYILSNVRKGPDIFRVARAVLDQDDGMFRLGRLMDQLIHRLEARQASLDSEGRELLAMAFFLSASNALEAMDYASCKQRCLAGMDLVPLPPGDIRLEDFLELLRAAKARAVTDRPVMSGRQQRRRAGPAAETPVVAEKLPDLTEQEQKLFAFLKKHRKASELDLRKVLGSRRVVGIMNQLIQKLNAAGAPVIGKKGMGDEGEMYEYTGT